LDSFQLGEKIRHSGFTPAQAELIVQVMESNLNARLRQTFEEMLSKQELENEAYLFDAARSELYLEISSLRTTQFNEYRSQLARLRRQVENLALDIHESLQLMKSTVRMDTEDQKNANRADARVIEMKIQEINNRITTHITSELRSEIEALKWQSTRRGLFAIGGAVF
ncbi:hypothetical protein CANCADRAFT_11554, partial [Tortispora caseinolytica NRRL Y-17796]